MNSSHKLVRWIMVVTLGCSLGLLLVFVVLSSRNLQRAGELSRAARRARVPAPQFQLCAEPMEAELQSVIESQLAAFRADDYPRAYQLAASTLKAQVPLPAFERMVKSGYPFIAQSRSAQFGVMLDNGQQAVVGVAISSGSGRTRHYQYILQHERSGWKIFGVTEVRAVGATI